MPRPRRLAHAPSPAHARAHSRALGLLSQKARRSGCGYRGLARSAVTSARTLRSVSVSYRTAITQQPQRYPKAVASTSCRWCNSQSLRLIHPSFRRCLCIARALRVRIFIFNSPSGFRKAPEGAGFRNRWQKTFCLSRVGLLFWCQQ